MRKNNCEMIRRELDELMLDEAFSTSAVEHLNECADCRQFHQTQTKLRRMVGSLGTVEAPPDFDFRLRARLANDSGHGAFHYWPVMQKGLAVAAMVVVAGFGVVVVRNVVNQPKETIVEQKNPPVQRDSPRQIETTQQNDSQQSKELMAQVPSSGSERNKSQRPAQPGSRINRLLSTKDSSKETATVFSELEAFNSEAGIVFPIDASLQPLRLSLDDGRGNAKTISVPTIRFGSQRMLPNRNQLAEKGIW